MGAWEATDPNTGDGSNADVTLTRYYSAGGVQLASKSTGGSTVITLGDVQGSAQVTVDASGAVTRNAYTPYGTKRTGSTIASAHGWLNQIADADTGLTYLNARYYDPELGRFLSPDPLMNPGDPRTLDPYRYADNNPVVYLDARGLNPSCGTYSATTAACWDGYIRSTGSTPSVGSSPPRRAPATGDGKSSAELRDLLGIGGKPWSGAAAPGVANWTQDDLARQRCTREAGYQACHAKEVQCEITFVGPHDCFASHSGKGASPVQHDPVAGATAKALGMVASGAEVTFAARSGALAYLRALAKGAGWAGSALTFLGDYLESVGMTYRDLPRGDAIQLGIVRASTKGAAGLGGALAGGALASWASGGNIPITLVGGAIGGAISSYSAGKWIDAELDAIADAYRRERAAGEAAG